LTDLSRWKARQNFLATINEDEKSRPRFDTAKTTLAEQLVLLGSAPPIPLLDTGDRQRAWAGAILFLDTHVVALSIRGTAAREIGESQRRTE
jgi:hypothetical protein